ncbi:MAG: hypothetical protein FWE13_06335, partial [Firmicutes bacterium]|nr:hypothetical protein [Bacillota bacterium]
TVRPLAWENIYSGIVSVDSHNNNLNLTVNSSLVKLDLEFIYGSSGGVSYLGEYVVQIPQGTSGYRQFLLDSGNTTNLWISFINGNLNVRIVDRTVNLLLISVYMLKETITDNYQLFFDRSFNSTNEVVFDAPFHSGPFFNRMLYVEVSGGLEFSGVLSFVGVRSDYIFTSHISIGLDSILRVRISHFSPTGWVSVTMPSFVGPINVRIWLMPEDSVELLFNETLMRSLWINYYSVTFALGDINNFIGRQFLITLDSSNCGSFLGINEVVTFAINSNNGFIFNRHIGNDSIFSFTISYSSQGTITIRTSITHWWGAGIRVWLLL